MLVSVVDVGGTHFVYALYDLAFNRLSPAVDIGQIEVSGLDAVDPLEALRAIGRHSRQWAGDALCGMSIAVPNPFDHIAGVSRMRHKLPSLYGVDLRKVLSEAADVPSDSLGFVNDADAFLRGALAVSREPPARTIGITLGTGIGSAFAVHGEVVNAGQGVPPQGEIWNLPFDSETIEDAISTRALVDAYEQRTGERKSVLAIARAARSGDTHSADVLVDFGLKLAQVLDQVSTPFGAEQILLGGGISGAADIFLPVTRGALKTLAVVSVMDDRRAAPLIGAGSLWTRRLRTMPALEAASPAQGDTR